MLRTSKRAVRSGLPSVSHLPTTRRPSYLAATASTCGAITRQGGPPDGGEVDQHGQGRRQRGVGVVVVHFDDVAHDQGGVGAPGHYREWAPAPAKSGRRLFFCAASRALRHPPSFRRDDPKLCRAPRVRPGWLCLRNRAPGGSGRHRGTGRGSQRGLRRDLRRDLQRHQHLLFATGSSARGLHRQRDHHRDRQGRRHDPHGLAGGNNPPSGDDRVPGVGRRTPAAPAGRRGWAS
jgi:hypothetical protein